MRISVIIPNFNGERWLPDCLDGLRGQTRAADQAIVVDNGSRDRSREIVRAHELHPELIELPENAGFAVAVNRGIRAAAGEVVALLNNDAVPDARWLEAGHAALARYPEVAMFASLMLQFSDHTRVDNAGDLYPRDGRPRPRGQGEPAAAYRETVEIASPCAGAAFYRKSLFAEVGEFEESFRSYLEDLDLGLRARRCGHRALLIPTAIVYHRAASTELHDRPGKKPVDSSERVRLIARNRLRLIARHWPAGFILRSAPWLMFGLLRSAAYHLLISGQARAFARGCGEGVRLMGADRREYHQAPGSFSEIARLMREGVRPWTS